MDLEVVTPYFIQKVNVMMVQMNNQKDFKDLDNLKSKVSTSVWTSVKMYLKSVI